jgi:GAF domain-containing protein
MFEIKTMLAADTAAGYAELEQQLCALLGNERDYTANAANTAALIFHTLPGLNWAGFYRLVGETLVIGPFQGKPACVRIPLGQGVCGTAAARRATVRVPNCRAFPGHIACDAASKSEIVLPLVAQGRLVGVLDLDSPVLSRFSEADQTGLERLAAVFVAGTDFE